MARLKTARGGGTVGGKGSPRKGAWLLCAGSTVGIVRIDRSCGWLVGWLADSCVRVGGPTPPLPTRLGGGWLDVFGPCPTDPGRPASP
jgi:hypothetical protein